MSKLSWGGSGSSWALESEEADEAATRAAPLPDLFPSPDESTVPSKPQLKKFNHKGTAYSPNGFSKMGVTSYDLSSECSNYNVGPRMQEAGNWGSKKQPQPLYRNSEPTLGSGDQEKGIMKERPKLVLERRKIELGATGQSLYRNENVDQKMDTNEEESIERKKKVNPFGDARPREVLLEEKGKDWRKIDLELEYRKVVRSETNEEKKLKQEINNLKLALSEVSKDPEKNSDEESNSLSDQIAQREKELELLICDFDNKVRFARKSTSFNDKRNTYSSDGQHSQLNIYDEHLISVDRTRPRGGKGNTWGRPMDDRRGFRGGKMSGIHGNRNIDRKKKKNNDPIEKAEKEPAAISREACLPVIPVIRNKLVFLSAFVVCP